MKPSTLLEKVWERHVVVAETADAPAVVYVDRHLVHEVTSPQAFQDLRRRGLGVARPERTLATLDHATPTAPLPPGGLPVIEGEAAVQVAELERNCREFGVRLHGMSSPERGIVHVMAPELGATWPGSTVVCGDSHTSTHGAFGALALGIGTSEVAHVLATQCLLLRKPAAMAVEADGRLGPGATAKDLILAIVARIGSSGGVGHVLEYRGEAIRALSMEERMTVCNMSIEAGARAGMIAPDAVALGYLRGRPLAPAGAAWRRAEEEWAALRTDGGARFDRTVGLDASGIEPMVTWGTSPAMAVPVTGCVPEAAGNGSEVRALGYMGLSPGERLAGRPIDVAFVGSCTNARLSDLRAAAALLRGRRVHARVRMLVVPGSQQVKREAEAEGLREVFLAAGAEWREPGCSMCIAMNGDRVEPGRRAISTSNRNFEGRQGPGARTHLASPLTVAASALRGCIADPREIEARP